MMSTPVTTGALERVIRRAGARRMQAAETCDVCRVAVPERHRHLLDTDRGEVLCTCQACTLLFVRDAASQGHYRLVPERRVRLAEVSTKRLGIPVGLAYFVPTGDGSAVAHYPSPIGATEWEVDPAAWQDAVGQRPELGGMQPEVEALLVNTARGRRHQWIVPIDDCFRLVAVVRREWTGLSGGSTVWPAVDRFFAELDERH